MIRNKRPRRVLAGTLIVLGGLLMWLAPEVVPGLILLGLGVVLESVGIALEHRDAH